MAKILGAAVKMLGRFGKILGRPARMLGRFAKILGRLARMLGRLAKMLGGMDTFSCGAASILLWITHISQMCRNSSIFCRVLFLLGVRGPPSGTRTLGRLKVKWNTKFCANPRHQIFNSSVEGRLCWAITKERVR